MPPIGVIMRSHNTQYHIYADETQEYISSDFTQRKPQYIENNIIILIAIIRF